MKISPVSQGTGTPAGSAATDRMPSDRIAAAKRVASGQVVEREVPQDRQVERAQASIHRIRMKTNASPEQNYLPQEDVDATQAVTSPEKAISDATEQAQTTEDTRPLGTQYADLAKRRRAVQTELAALKAERAAFEAQKNGSNPDSEFRARLKAQPLQTILSEGITYDQLTQDLLAEQSGSTPQFLEMQKKIEALEKGFDTKLSERDAQAETQVLAEMDREADSLIATGDDFELVRETGSKPQALELIKRTYKTTGEILDVSEALTLIENELVTESLKLANLKKVQTKLKPEPQQIATQPQKQMRTLTARDGASMPLTPTQRAYAAFNGTLRK
jgi:hypothetical protein